MVAGWLLVPLQLPVLTYVHKLNVRKALLKHKILNLTIFNTVFYAIKSEYIFCLTKQKIYLKTNLGNLKATNVTKTYVACCLLLLGALFIIVGFRPKALNYKIIADVDHSNNNYYHAQPLSLLLKYSDGPSDECNLRKFAESHSGL